MPTLKKLPEPVLVKTSPLGDLVSITAREFEVLRRLCQGKTPGEIALELSLAPKTIESHRQTIKYKLNLPDGSMAQFLLFGLRWGLVTVEVMPELKRMLQLSEAEQLELLNLYLARDQLRGRGLEVKLTAP